MICLQRGVPPRLSKKVYGSIIRACGLPQALSCDLVFGRPEIFFRLVQKSVYRSRLPRVIGVL